MVVLGMVWWYLVCGSVDRCVIVLWVWWLVGG